MGPLTQIIFICLISYLEIGVEDKFYLYHYFILLFNLLPIYPLDGGRLLELGISFFISYYKSLKSVIYCSFFLYSILLINSILWQKNLVLSLMLLLLGLKLKEEIKQVDYYFHKFLTERYIYHYSFKKAILVKNIKEMKRDYYHYFKLEKKVICEEEKLNSYFLRNKEEYN